VPEGFREFVTAHSRSLLRTGWLLAGDEATAQDLVQTALLKTWPRWERLDPAGAEAYVQRVMISTFLTWRRRRWHGEMPVDELPELAEDRDVFGDSDMRSAVVKALATLPRRQRAVVVLRFFDDLTEVETAKVLGCSVGTVKSQTAKAFTHLRTSELADLLTEEPLT
jgi:RNA polymerase sigma-70 factor (sigma-E family)